MAKRLGRGGSLRVLNTNIYLYLADTGDDLEGGLCKHYQRQGRWSLVGRKDEEFSEKLGREADRRQSIMERWPHRIS